ncbi:hypothetical protein SDJN02_27267, partial [Cucurbita argyrosperma subsp. argyrosperma]
MVQDKGATWLCCPMQPTGNIPHIWFLFRPVPLIISEVPRPRSFGREGRVEKLYISFALGRITGPEIRLEKVPSLSFESANGWFVSKQGSSTEREINVRSESESGIEPIGVPQGLIGRFWEC